jgi:hypothetical protein
MQQVRILVDDLVGCNTQRAVLSVFVSELRKNKFLSVIEMSREPMPEIWDDVPVKSSNNLAARLSAFKSTVPVTVFLPGHIIPGDITPVDTFHGAICANNFRSVSGLDIFVVKNKHKQVQKFLDFVAVNPDYDSVADYISFDVDKLPNWIFAGGVASVLDLRKRPWYFAQTSVHTQWLSWVKKAIDQGFLNIEMVEDDVSKGVVRPSLLGDVKQLISGVEDPLIHNVIDDSFFTPPEWTLSYESLKTLNSVELQQRTIEFLNKKVKVGRSYSSLGWAYRIRSVARKVIKRASRFCFKFFYSVYSLTIRNLIIYLRRK